MLSNLTIALFLGAGTGAWIFAKMMRHTGNNTKSSIIVAIVSGALILLIFAAILDKLFKH